MEIREAKAWAMTGDARVSFSGGSWKVHSQTESRYYSVNPSPSAAACECEDFALRAQPCKHILAVRKLLERQLKGEPNPTPDQIPGLPPRPTYGQDWPAYNLAQTNEKDHLQTLLAALCAGIPQPAQKPKSGRPFARLADAIFGVVFKVYSLMSARRFASDMREAQRRGHVVQPLSYNCILEYMGYADVTPILISLIHQSSLPLRAVETTFAVDSSGFSTSRYTKWYDEKYGTNRTKADWVKAHLCVGTKTQVVTACVIDEKNSGDSPHFEALATTTAENFTINEMSGDKAYLSNDNLELVNALGGTAYIPFKSNSTVGGGAEIWRRMFHYFAMNREEYLTHYHKRSNVESAFSMVKRKFGDSLRAKTDTAMRNEVLAKIVCHNLCVNISAWYELGIDPGDWLPKGALQVAEQEDTEPRDVLRFPAG